LLLVLN